MTIEITTRIPSVNDSNIESVTAFIKMGFTQSAIKVLTNYVADMEDRIGTARDVANEWENISLYWRGRFEQANAEKNSNENEIERLKAQFRNEEKVSHHWYMNWSKEFESHIVTRTLGMGMEEALKSETENSNFWLNCFEKAQRELEYHINEVKEWERVSRINGDAYDSQVKRAKHWRNKFESLRVNYRGLLKNLKFWEERAAKLANENAKQAVEIERLNDIIMSQRIELAEYEINDAGRDFDIR